MMSLLSAAWGVYTDVGAAAERASAPSPLTTAANVCRRNHHTSPACNIGRQVKRLYVSGPPST